MMLTCQTLIQEIFQNLGLKEKGSSMENGGYIFTRRSIQCYICLRVQKNTVQIASILKMIFTLNYSTISDLKFVAASHAFGLCQC